MTHCTDAGLQLECADCCSPRAEEYVLYSEPDFIIFRLIGSTVLVALATPLFLMLTLDKLLISRLRLKSIIIIQPHGTGFRVSHMRAINILKTEAEMFCLCLSEVDVTDQRTSTCAT